MQQIIFKDSDFRRLTTLVYESSGIALTESKRDLVLNRLTKVVRARGFSTFSEYLNYVGGNKEVELPKLLNEITTNLTYFFRESHHFEFLSEIALPSFAKQKNGRVYKMYSAGCSTGEELISAAITFEKFKNRNPNFEYEIVGTDLDQSVIKFASRGVYSEQSMAGLTLEDKKIAFNKGTGPNVGFCKLKPDIAKRIRVFQKNIMEPFGDGTVFDVIFCRNVLIYFDRRSQVNALSNFSNCIQSDGYLLLGHSESMVGHQHHFKLESRTIYRPVV